MILCSRCKLTVNGVRTFHCAIYDYWHHREMVNTARANRLYRIPTPRDHLRDLCPHCVTMIQSSLTASLEMANAS